MNNLAVAPFVPRVKCCKYLSSRVHYFQFHHGSLLCLGYLDDWFSRWIGVKSQAWLRTKYKENRHQPIGYGCIVYRLYWDLHCRRKIDVRASILNNIYCPSDRLMVSFDYQHRLCGFNKNGIGFGVVHVRVTLKRVFYELFAWVIYNEIGRANVYVNPASA